MLALVAAIDPVRIGIVALLISRPRPMLNLFVFWFAGVTAGIAAALLLLLVHRDLMLSVMRVVGSVISSSVVAPIQVAVGVIAVVIGARLLARERARAGVTGGDHSTLLLKTGTPAGSRRLSIRRKLEGETLLVAVVAGVGWATPPVEYLAAIIAILASRAATAAQLSAALMFTFVAFTVAEIPLISYLVMPAKTVIVVLRLHDWVRARRHTILAVVVGVAGVLLVIAGARNV
ncbi:GAP family protein [Mycobacterium sp. JS623]|uniref:GAP family protein n=1 Tax=Mycobacterium sp. JS623 TaxID=212767 RepID=UPI00068673D8|nr:GAP family protein [Mycobacterium sp. JS623]